MAFLVSPHLSCSGLPWYAYENRKHLLKVFMEPREHLHRIVDTLPDATLQTAVQFLVSLQERPVEGKNPLLIADLGWTQEQAADTRARLASFAEDWDAPAMEGYDDL